MIAQYRGQVGSMAIKLDISKAYHHVEWTFLEGMTRALGFAEHWVYLIMKCVTSTSYSVLLNGQVGAMFTLSCGLHQGDPISPYLYLICAEGISVLLMQIERVRFIHGVKAARGVCPPISHLLFADVCLIFCWAKINEWQAVQQVLYHYEQALSQCINRHKSSVF